MCPESFAGFRFYLGPHLQGRMWYLILVMDCISLIIGREVLDVKTTYRKSFVP